MNKDYISANLEKESKKIKKFIKTTFAKHGIKRAVIAVSGGIDSATSLRLTATALGSKNVVAIHLPYHHDHEDDFKSIVKSAGIPKENIQIVSIKKMVDTIAAKLNIKNNDSQENRIRLGNIAARVRMITIYDFAKKESALVVGTENKTEALLSYFTRFGDEASDLEPIQHLYKTQVYALAKYLKVPQKILDKKPTAGLWIGQTDEDEFGFSYREADNVLLLYFEKKKSVNEIEKLGFSNAKAVIERVKKNEFKHQTPYKIN